MAFYDFIRIYGAEESGEVYQGLGAAALYNDAASLPESGRTPASTQAAETQQAAFAEMWGIQNEWIDAEIARLESLLSVLEGTEILQMPEIELEAATRGIWSSITGRLSRYASGWIPILGQAIMVIGLVADTIAVVDFAYDIYKRFWVGKETLRHLPGALIELCKMTIDLLRKIRDLPQTPENFEMRATMATNLTERFEQQFQWYLTDAGNQGQIGTMTVAAEQLTQALENLAYNDEDIDLGGVRVSLRSKVITEP